MRFNKQPICTYCRTGKEQQVLDANQPFCPYILLHKGNTCPMFKPLAETRFGKKGFISKIFRK